MRARKLSLPARKLGKTGNTLVLAPSSQRVTIKLNAIKSLHLTYTYTGRTVADIFS